jgi:hypothetical protein
MKRFTTADTKSRKRTALDILNNRHLVFKDRLHAIMQENLVSEKLERRFAVWCARQVQHLMVDKRSLYALDVAEAYAENRWLIDDADYAAAWEDELGAAWAAAAATDVVADAAARAAASAVERVVSACDVAWIAALAAARAAAEAATRDETLAEVWDAALAAARAAQEQKLREMLIEGIETGDTKC